MSDPSRKTGAAVAVAATAFSGFLAYDANALYPKMIELMTPAEVATEAVVAVDAWQSGQTFTSGLGQAEAALPLGQTMSDVMLDAVPLDSTATLPHLAIADGAVPHNSSLLMVRMPQLNPALVQQPGQNAATLATAITDDAQTAILSDLARGDETLTAAQMTDLIRAELSRAAESAAAKTSKVRFEVLTGKLAINPTFTILGAEVAFGEVNLYSVSAVAGVGMMACKGLSPGPLGTCVARALSKAFVGEAKAGEAEASAK